MPVKECQLSGKQGYKWGDAGKCYTYDKDSEQSKKDAKQKAINQGIAMGEIKVSKEYHEETKEKRFVKATVYESNLYTCKQTGEYFTVCKQCDTEQYVKDSDGYCINCGEPLGDMHGDLIAPNDVEEMQLLYMKNINDKILNLDNIIKSILNGEEFDLMQYIKSAKHHVGLNHINFSDTNGYLAESHCVFDKFNAFGEEYEKCTWKAAFVVSEDIFEKVKCGVIKGFSFGGKGYKQALNKTEENINE